MLRWDETTGAVGVFRQPAGYPNGSTLDGLGRLVTCEHGNRRVTRTEHDGSQTVIADRFEGKRFNSPNDVVVASDGSVWFTDPSYGIDSDYEGFRAESEIGACHVYRVDPVTGAVRIAADDFDRPNGLAFSLDERRLYVADTRANHLRVFDVADDGALSGGEVFADCTVGAFDGLRLDDAGRIWVSAGDGVHCYDPDGTLIGKLRVPETVANLAFGGRRRNHLFVCATTSVYAILLSVTGAPGPRTAPGGR
jgi:gluconolactonase